jgi:Enoyl-CoA hydratase/isomerase
MAPSPRPPTPHYTPAEVLDLLAGDAEGVGPWGPVPLLVVELAAGAGLNRLSRLLGALPCVTIGLADDASRWADPPPFDILVAPGDELPRPWIGDDDGFGDPQRSLDALHQAVSAAPLAALTLAQVLRAGRHLDRDDAVVVESLAYSMLQSGPEFARWLAEGRRPVPAPAGPDPAVLVERDGELLRVVLNRPEVHNAVDRRLRDDLVGALRLAEIDPQIERVRLSGTGASFSSGGDLSEFGTAPDPARAHAVRTTRSPARLLHRLGPCTTAVVHGVCVGAGLELAAFAARVVARPSAVFWLPELSFGLIPGSGGTASLPPRIGAGRTAFLALSGRRLDASAAARWGIVDEIRAVGS